MKPSALEDFELPILAHIEPELAPEAVRIAIGDPDLGTLLDHVNLIVPQR
jgi:hypothetical protein